MWGQGMDPRVEVGSWVWWLGYLILAAVALCLFRWAPRQGDASFERWRFCLGWLVLANQSWFLVMAILDGGYSPTVSLPFDLCGMSQVLLFLHLVLRQKWALTLAAFWGPLGGLFAFLTPALWYDMAYVVQFYLAHSFVLLIPLYLLRHGGESLSPGAPLTAFWAINVTGGILFIINPLLGSNYFFVTRSPPGWEFLVWPWYLIAYQPVVIIAFLGLARIYRAVLGPPGDAPNATQVQ